jgi:AraC-like DNA-binding protein
MHSAPDVGELYHLSHNTAQASLALPLAADETGLVHHERTWRHPEPHSTLREPSWKGLVSKWVDGRASTREEKAAALPEFYTIGLARKRTDATFYVSGNTVHQGEISAGAFHITEPHEPVRGIFHAPCEFIHLFISERFVSQCLEDLEIPQIAETARFDKPFKRDATIEQLINSFCSQNIPLFQLGRLYTEGVCLAIVGRLISLQYKQAKHDERSKPTSLQHWRLKRSLEYIETNIAEPITLADVAAASGLTRMYFASQFRAATGLRPHEYILRRRIDRAQEMLLSSNMTLIEATLSVGFQTQAHFTTVFKKIVGQTPHRWREENVLRSVHGPVSKRRNGFKPVAYMNGT